MNLPNDILPEIAKHLDLPSFKSLLLTDKNINKTLSNAKLPQNAGLKTEKICYQVFHQKQNIFISGPGGCGKTYTMKRICALAPKYGRKHAITATTGIAATNFENGVTIHSFSGLGLAKQRLEKILAEYEEKNRIPGRTRWQNIDLLLIDEVSMLGANLLEKLDLVARLARGNDLPMGGIQMVISGDFLQLPPVGDRYAFLSPLWSKLKLQTYAMDIPVRQGEDLPFFNLLNRIRTNRFTQQDLNTIAARVRIFDENALIKPTRIYSTNSKVEEINQLKFNELTTPIEYVFHANDTVVKRSQVNGRWVYEISTAISISDARNQIRSRLLHTAPDVISLRKEAQYILTQNLDVKRGLVNGSRCVYTGEQLFQFTDDLSRTIHPSRFCFPLGNDHFLIREQLPLRLGYAVTIHSSQGMSLDCAIMDLGKELLANCNSMVYVALSRVRKLESLYLINFEPKKVRANANALKFYAGTPSPQQGLRPLPPLIPMKEIIYNAGTQSPN